MKVAGLTCSGCGADDLISVQPGEESIYAPPPLNFRLHPGTRDRAFCRRCFTKAFSGVNAMFAGMATNG